MATRVKTATEAAPAATSVADMIGDWIRQGTEGFIATQKILLDLAAQQNALALTIVRERLGLFSPAPSKAALNLIGKGAHNLFEAQHALLDLVARQNAILTEGLKPGFAGTAVEGLAEVVHRGVDNFIEAQKHFLKIFEAETEYTITDFGDRKSLDTQRLSDSAREAMANFLESQRKFLEIVEEELVTKKSREGEAAGDVDLFEIAKQSVDSFVKAQEKLLDLASDQVDVNVKFARDMFRGEPAKRSATAFPDIVKKSVDSFVAAQKALVELASKPRKPAQAAAEPEPEMVGAKA